MNVRGIPIIFKYIYVLIVKNAETMDVKLDSEHKIIKKLVAADQRLQSIVAGLHEAGFQSDDLPDLVEIIFDLMGVQGEERDKQISDYLSKMS